MFRNRIGSLFRTITKFRKKATLCQVPKIIPITTVGLITVSCQQNVNNVEMWDGECLEHEFLIRQATTVNVNAATQLLTVTLVAIQDTSERLRLALAKEISLMKHTITWGEEGTPPEHFDELVAVRHSLADLKHNLQLLLGYMEYAEKLATISAEISYLSGNVVASDAICERISHATRACGLQQELNHKLQSESLEIQQQAIASSPQLQEQLQTSENPTMDV